MIGGENSRKPVFGFRLSGEGLFCKGLCLKLHTPDGISLSLTYNDEPVFWSFFSHDLYDVYLVRSYAESWQAYQPVGYIGSRVNEHIARQPAAEQGLLWNKYFIEQLAAHNAGLLGIGEWHFDYRPAQTLPQRWGECWHDTALGRPETDENYAQWLFSGSRFDALDNDFHTQAERFIALKTHHAEDDRLKYWRKRARQNQLPPVLVYELPALSDRWLILDGHLRLAAALAEGQLPPLIVIQATTARPDPRTAAERETVLRGVGLQLLQPGFRGDIGGGAGGVQQVGAGIENVDDVLAEGV